MSEVSDAPSRKRFTTLLVLLLLTGVAQTFVLIRSSTPSGPSVALAMSYETGQSYRYAYEQDMHMQVESLGFKLPVRTGAAGVLAMEVLDIDAEGVSTIRSAIEDFQVTVNGVPAPIPPTVSLDGELEIAQDGRVLSATGFELGASAGSGQDQPFGYMDQFTPLLPEGEVGPGDTWTKEFLLGNPFGDGHIRYETQNEFLKYEDINGRETAAIASSLAAPFSLRISASNLEAAGGQFGSSAALPPDTEIDYIGRITSEQTSWIDPTSGEMVRMEGAAEFSISINVVSSDSQVPAALGETGVTGTLEQRMELLD